MASSLRSFRVDDGVWSAALARARSEGTTVSALLSSALAEYAARGRPPRPETPGEIEAKVARARQAAEMGRAIAAEQRIRRREQPAAEKCRHPMTRRIKGVCSACGLDVVGGSVPKSASRNPRA